MKRRIFLVITLLWMAVIFAFSSRDADASTEDSYAVGLTVGHIFVAGFDEKTESERLAFAAIVDHPIRKTAHALEYALLGFLMAGTIFGYLTNNKNEASVSAHTKTPLTKNPFLIAWLLATAYAATDEFHQTFVPGRSGQISDVCLDSAGALLGVVVYFLIWKKTATRKS